MKLTAKTPFSNLEPEHTIHERTTPLGDDVIVVVCPVVDPETGAHFESQWDADENDAEAVNCLFCETADRINGNRTDGFIDHGCYDSGDRDDDAEQ